MFCSSVGINIEFSPDELVNNLSSLSNIVQNNLGSVVESSSIVPSIVSSSANAIEKIVQSNNVSLKPTIYIDIDELKMQIKDIEREIHKIEGQEYNEKQQLKKVNEEVKSIISYERCEERDIQKEIQMIRKLCKKQENNINKEKNYCLNGLLGELKSNNFDEINKKYDNCLGDKSYMLSNTIIKMRNDIDICETKRQKLKEKVRNQLQVYKSKQTDHKFIINELNIKKEDLKSKLRTKNDELNILLYPIDYQKSCTNIDFRSVLHDDDKRFNDFVQKYKCKQSEGISKHIEELYDKLEFIQLEINECNEQLEKVYKSEINESNRDCRISNLKSIFELHCKQHKLCIKRSKLLDELGAMV